MKLNTGYLFILLWKRKRMKYICNKNAIEPKPWETEGNAWWSCVLHLFPRVHGYKSLVQVVLLYWYIFFFFPSKKKRGKKKRERDLWKNWGGVSGKILEGYDGKNMILQQVLIRANKHNISICAFLPNAFLVSSKTIFNLNKHYRSLALHARVGLCGW